MTPFVSLPLVGINSDVVSATAIKNPLYFESIDVPSANELILFPTANAVIKVRHEKALEIILTSYFTTLSPSAIQSSINSAVAGVVSKGQAALVAGVLAVTIPGLTTSNLGFSQLVAQAGTSTTVYEYKAVCTANTLTITAVTVAGATVTTDTSTVNYFAL